MPELKDEPGQPETLPLQLVLLYSSPISGKELKAGSGGRDKMMIRDGLWTTGRDGAWTTSRGVVGTMVWGKAWTTGRDEAWMLGQNEAWTTRRDEMGAGW